MIKVLVARSWIKFTTALRRNYWAWRLEAFGAGANIYPMVQIHCPSRVRLGDNVVINGFVHIWGGGGVEVGADTLIAAHCVITSQTHDVNALLNRRTYRETNVHAPVKIGRNVWLGSHVTILPGIEIGDNSIIAAGSVVTKSIPPNTLVMGVPARPARTLHSPLFAD